jgi:hypothetical protein
MKKSGWIITAIIIGAIGLIILMVSIVWILKDEHYFKMFSSIDSKTASELGDYLSGFVGVFWTGSGAILIYATFRAQRLQTEKQNFETTYFNLLNIYHNLANSTEGKIIDYQNNDIEIIKGRRFFSEVLRNLKSKTHHEDFLKSICQKEEIPEMKMFMERIRRKQENTTLEIKPEWQIMSDLEILMIGSKSKEYSAAQYEYIFQSYQTQLGHYFRFLFNVFKYIITERESYKDERKYLGLLQAQMSNDEHGLLFYNAISKYGRSITGEYKFYNWLVKYDFFENIDPESLINRDHHNYYPTSFRFLTPDEK